ncbi:MULTISPECIES: type VI secretion system protein TssA [Escherichia]|uniref:type VI secretion system protein TssA n=1 Tax=Escherichia TaxID=561 RepID=UPI0002B9AA8A|nr:MULTISPECIES: type VI secretion system ImpA family N-terminal domain-containing protein [Escherichia]EFB2842041.1 cytoplasmic protein [Escherichia coli]EFJ2713215.1 ImpA family type VI secretion system protein [Escherichia coli]EHS3896772.1 ImpA family type VI secretion system protein [Escherichia coli]EHS4058755.1 ImpA family type VI secretion system protein [Escherichia coli]EHW6095746.1 ImpA family type VI secretion system protein [Escherichia coli]
MDTPLSDPISAECPCGPDLEYDPEYLLLFTRALAREEAQYGDFVSTPETINWAELERDARRLLARSKDIRILVVLLRCRIQQAGARGLVETLTLLETLCVTNPDTIHPQLLTAEDTTAEDAAVARSNALSALLDHEGVMADIRGITLSNNAAMRLQVRDVERSLSASRPADALAPESVRQQLADLEARGALPLDAFRQAAEITERLQHHARETLNDLAPDFSRLTQLLTLLPGAVQTTTPEIPQPKPQADQPKYAAIDNTRLTLAGHVAPTVDIPAETTAKIIAEPQQISDRNDALKRLRVIRRWFEHSEPSSPTIPLLRQAERLVGKRFSEIINEVPAELLEKWDAQE